MKSALSSLHALIVGLPAKALATVGHLPIFATLLITLFTLTLTFSSPARADNCAIDPNNTDVTDKEIVDQINKCLIEKNDFDDKGFTLNASIGLINALNTQILGYSALHPELAQITNGRGALAYSSNLITSLYSNPPISGVQYMASEIQKFNPVQPAYAATTGQGYDALQPVQKLWTVFRNASYVGFVIVFVVVGFMIMFRAHISPQAVATVQDSVPRIVIALFLVTFSYAIAGLMIDLMFLVINLVINLLGQSGVADSAKASEAVFGHSIFGVILGGWFDIVGTTAGALSQLLKDTVNLGSIGNFLIWKGLGGIGALIVGIAALIIMFRIFIMLLMAYVMIILLTLIAPFFFLIQALPGNNGASTWFKQMASQIAIFPAVSLMIILAGVIAGIGAWGGTGAGEFQSAGTQALKFPLLVGGLDPNAIGKIIGLGILFMTPQVGELVKNMIGVKGGPNIAGGIMGGVAAGAGLAGRFAGEVAPNVPYVGTGLDILASRRNAPKLRRQAIENERILADYETQPGTTLYKRKGH